MSERQLEELRARSAELCEDFDRAVAECQEINERYGKGNQDQWPIGQRTRHENLSRRANKLKDDIGDIADQIERIERVHQTVRSASRDGGRGLERDGGPTLLTRSHSGPWDGLDASLRGDTPTGLRTRALDAVEVIPDVPTDSRRTAANLIDADPDGGVAQWVLASADPAYLRAFGAVARDPNRGHLMWSAEEQEAFRRAEYYSRAMNEGSGSAGSYLVPFALDPNVIITNTGVQSTMRQIARTVQVASNAWHGVSSAGVSAEWKAEAAEAAAANPTLAQPSIPVFLADAYVEYSIELEGDTNIASQLGTLFADAKANLEEAAFVTGNGTSQPKGIVTALVAASKTVNTGTNDTFAVGDLYSLKAALPPRYRQRASWLAAEEIYDKARQFATGTGPQSAFWADLGMGTPPQLLGKPAYISSGMDGTIDASANNYLLAYGQFDQYVVVDRLGSQVELVPHVVGTNRRPLGVRGAFFYWRVGADVVNADAFRLLNA